jgi:FAD/FMN-containing dehydrogenase/Fe-S oxidoreductase
MSAQPRDTSPLEARLARELEGEVYFDALSRGRYATDASMYQILPLGVVVPQHHQDVLATLQIAAEQGVPVLPRGAGTSQAGQTVGEALVIDGSKYLRNVKVFEPGANRATVEPGIVLDELNRFLRPHGVFFPVDVSTASRATIGGMAGNNSVGARSLHYGHTVDNILGIRAVLADGTELELSAAANGASDGRVAELKNQMRALYARNATEIEKRYPKVARNVAGYNIDRLGGDEINLAELLVGSEGTLAWFKDLDVALQPIPANKVLGVCHFPTFRDAMESSQHIVKLNPAATELIDKTVLDLAADIPAFADSLKTFIVGQPAAVLLVEFAGESRDECLRQLNHLEELMGELGFPEGVLRAEHGEVQGSIWSLRKAALNIVMSMKGDGKPISFVEDCAVPLDKLGEYTQRLTDIFESHDTTGTWYAHAGAGCLHVRPILNLKQNEGVRKMRAICDAAHDMIREYKGTHSGEHGDGLVRSEFLEPFLGPQIIDAFREIKQTFDPDGRFNPGKIVDPPKMDEREIMRFPSSYAVMERKDALDWSVWGGFYRATEMCNNNGACRKNDAAVMCPSYRVTRDEQHVTRGRANSLRLALTGQVPSEDLTSKALYDTLDLCVGCKACKRECPAGVDVTRMKIEFLHGYKQRWGYTLRDKLIAYLPRYAPLLSRVPWLANTANFLPLRWIRERMAGLSAKRLLPSWRRDVFAGTEPLGEGREVVLLVDTFNTYFEPETARAAVNVLEAAGYRVITPKPVDGGKPLCCGRTFLNAGMTDEARVEVQRTLETLSPYVERGVQIIGLEPSCLLTLRDEFAALKPGEAAAKLSDNAVLLEEFLVSESAQGRLELALSSLPQARALLHGHCHQKAFGAMSSVEKALNLIPDLDVGVVASSCCGMAGAFGYEEEHYDTSMEMAELSLLPAVRNTDADTLIVADGTSCRTQIRDGAGREALHVARVLERALRKS